MVAIIMGSDSDLPIMSSAAELLDELQVTYKIDIVSAHRTPERMVSFALTAEESGYGTIIAGAGGAAHLPGMVASLTPLPVIGVPVKTRFNDGLDSLLSIVQMPRGVPVATVAVNNARNAALLAVRILALTDEGLAHRHRNFMSSQRDRVLSQAEDMEQRGWRDYLKGETDA
ncbi:MAG TPA: 5-(carboxyamino)imidazole ribonucleotide mutase [Alkalispirochaeta sp.]|nr:5-(carboxyamino)imidazole ribonucleotide mutase [Alkalispirochaeta sp.]